jgi:tungstate transport system ATP-binding protein
MPSLLEINDLLVKAGGTILLDLPALVVEKNEVLVVVGPNGAGKSTLLQVIAGLKKPARGSVKFTNSPHLADLAYRRRISTVYQSPLLLSGSVESNIASGLKFRGMKEAEIRRRVDHWMNQLHITHLAKRRSNSLSGGEAQRVSLARAFCLETELILMDEPFSALDTPTQQELLQDLREIFSRTSQTCVYVTHDLEEGLAIGDRVAVLFNGRLHQLDRVSQVFSHPNTPEVAAFVGVENIIPGKVERMLEDLVQVRANGSLFEVVSDLSPGTPVFVCLRPEDITLYNNPEEVMPSSARNRLSCRVTQLINQGPLTRVHLEAGFPLTALVTRPSAKEMDLQVGREVVAVFKSTAIHLIESSNTAIRQPQ